MSGNFKFSHNFIYYHHHPSTLMPELSAAECLAELQAKRMEEQEAELKAAMEEEQWAAEAARKVEEEWLAAEKKAVKKLLKKQKTAELSTGQETEGSEAPKKKRAKAKVLEEVAEMLAETAMVTCKWWVVVLCYDLFWCFFILF